MQCYDQEINMIEWMYALTDELCVGTLWVKLSCLNRCLVPYEVLFSTQNTRAHRTDMTKGLPEMKTHLGWQLEARQDILVHLNFH